MAARSFRRTGRPASITTGATLVALLAVLLLAGSALAAKPAAPTVKSPTGTIATAKPTFKWTKVPKATKYEVRVYKGTKQLLKQKGITKVSWKSSTSLPKNVSLTWKVRAGSASGNGAWSASLAFSVALAIGDPYQGGKIAYLFQMGDPGFVAGQTHGLIAAPVDQTKSAGIQWYNGTNTATGATGTALGAGSANTAAIIATQGTPATAYAAGVAQAYRGGGYADWYLPSKDELNQLYLHQAAIGGFGPHYYWSSSEFDAGTAWAKAFDISSPVYAYSKNNTSYVRAVRTF